MAYLAISRRAARDLEAIRRRSVERWGERVAEEYLESIEQALERLRENPDLLRIRREFSRHFRFHRVRQHFLVCCRVETNLYVLAVKHGNLDLPNRLAELEPSLLKEAELLHKTFLARLDLGGRPKQRPNQT